MHPRNPSRHSRLVAGFTLLLAGLASAQTTRPIPRPEQNPRLFERLDAMDRALLQQLVGFAPPAFRPELTWVGGEPATWAALKGKVVLVQSWSNKSTIGRNAIKRAERLLDDPDNADLRVVLVHTPEGAENLQNFLERRAVKSPIALDSLGAFCDDIGFYKQPANILVDRNGVVRLVGLNARGVREAVEALLAETADPSFEPPVRGAKPEESTSTSVFPVFSVPVHDADDLRGQPAPPFYIKRWETPEPNARGKVVVLNFWSTDCDICVRLLPKLNDLADRFGNDLCVVSISDESSGNFEEGREEQRIRNNDLRHAVALDSTSRMKNAFGVRRIPHAVVISSDWVVRWQGHPGRLEADVVSRIIRADRAGSGAGGAGEAVLTERPRRWGR